MDHIGTLTAPDERKGKPSASRMHRIMACEASLQLEAILPPGPESDDAERGTAMHKAFETHDDSDLSFEERETVTTARAQVKQIIADHLPGEVPDIIREKRLWMGEDFSGQADLIAFGKKTTVIVDFKSGRNEVEAPEDNWQLRTLAVLVIANYVPADRYVVAVVQPHCGTYAAASFTQKQVWQFMVDISQGLARGYAPEALQRTKAGEHCHHCRALGMCASTRTEVNEVACLPTKLEIMPSDQLGELGAKADRVEKAVELIREEIRARINAGVDVPGWKLTKGASRRSIPDAVLAYNKLSNSLNVHQFLDCCNVGLGKLVQAVALSEGFTEKESEDEVKTKLGGAVMVSQDRASLRRCAAPALIEA